jgi:hypothetical protein
VRPQVFILTDGSGAVGLPRLNATTALLAECGARRGQIYGRFTDLEAYAAILNRDFEIFANLASELADSFVAEDVDCVVGDAAEGYNSIHDLCRIIINTAVKMYRRASNREIANFDFPVVGPPDTCPEDLRSDALYLRLDQDAFARKLNTARKYYPELVDELTKTLLRVELGVYRRYLDQKNEPDSSTKPMTIDSLRTECLRPVRNTGSYGPFSNNKPFYEYHGEQQVAAGRYSQAIRFVEHMKPLAEALWNYAEANS